MRTKVPWPHKKWYEKYLEGTRSQLNQITVRGSSEVAVKAERPC